jgi:hypothetical protein
MPHLFQGLAACCSSQRSSACAQSHAEPGRPTDIQISNLLMECGEMEEPTMRRRSRFVLEYLNKYAASLGLIQ